MTLFSSTQPSLSVRVLPRFPARVIAGNGMTITKSGNAYTFAVTSVVATLEDLPDISSDRLMGRDTDGTGAPEELTVSGGIGFTAAGGIQLDANQRIERIDVQFYNGGSAIGTGIYQDMLVPFSCVITKATLLADQTGSIVVDIWKNLYSVFPPTVAGTITAAAKPTLSSEVKSQDSTLTGWTTAITAGDILRFNVDSATTVTRVLLQLEVTKV